MHSLRIMVLFLFYSCLDKPKESGVRLRDDQDQASSFTFKFYYPRTCKKRFSSISSSILIDFRIEMHESYASD